MNKRNKNISVGDIFGLLEVIDIKYVCNKKKAFCKCACGNNTVTFLYNLKSGNTKSCGCLSKKIKLDMNKTHGLSKSRLYQTFHRIIERTNDPLNKSYKDYGGRGIKCEWKNIEEFTKDMLPTFVEGLSIDRIDNDGNYCKENCRWANPKEQARNRRSNIIYEDKCVWDWCKELGLKQGTIYHRIRVLGWDVKKSLFTPVRIKKLSNNN